MANFLLLPSFHFKIRLAAFQLVAETVVVLLLPPPVLLPGKELRIFSPSELPW